MAETPISLSVGAVVAIFLLFSVAFRGWVERHTLARRIANYGIVPGMIIAIVVGWAIGEYQLPDIQWGIT